MDYRILVDSGCDPLAALTDSGKVTSIPLTLQLGEQSYRDDSTLDVSAFLKKMKETPGMARSACPSPLHYAEAMAAPAHSLVVTLSSRLSGSYNSALLGKDMAGRPEAVHVFDSKSAAAGELLLALKLLEYAEADTPFAQTVEKSERFRDQMKTYFVLENLDNLVKSGRMSRVKAKFASLLGIRPILGADGGGEIGLFGQARGAGAALKKLADTIIKAAGDPEHRTLVITHCKNSAAAYQLRDLVQRGAKPFQRVWVAQAGGISTLYANEGGVIAAF